MTVRSVEVFEAVSGVWTVRVTDGDAADEATFTFEGHARSYGDGQRIRLGLYVDPHEGRTSSGLAAQFGGDTLSQ